jgi:fucose permease
MALAGSVLLLVAILVPVSELSLILFGLTGIAFGPVYPLIVAAAGARMPDRSALVASVLTFAAVVGVIAYPPLVGFLSVTIGLQAALVGAVLLVAACGLALAVARRIPTAA